MSGRVILRPASFARGTRCFRLTVAATRANALEPCLLRDLHAALDQAEQGSADAILICGGPNFSSGGDVGLFLKADREGRGPDYAREVVGLLQSLVLRLVSMPRLVGVAARGAITGGSAGLLFASDLAVLSPDAFVQPYYAQVGFAPDGGWTALLPERIGAGAALDWLLSDRRADAEALVGLGLARKTSAEPEAAAEALLDHQATDALIAAKRLIWDEARRKAFEARLASELETFIQRIVAPGVRDGMDRFLHGRESAHV